MIDRELNTYDLINKDSLGTENRVTIILIKGSSQRKLDNFGIPLNRACGRAARSIPHPLGGVAARSLISV